MIIYVCWGYTKVALQAFFGKYERCENKSMIYFWPLYKQGKISVSIEAIYKGDLHIG